LPSRSELLARLLGTLSSSLDVFDARGFSASRDAWRALHAYQGRRVRVSPGRDAAFDAEVVDVAPDGALVVTTPDGRTLPLSSAEISLRAK
jgi:BirA family biotin operon repressor/biotin-[acetyl-CoA-carboxylase] ligase